MKPAHAGARLLLLLAVALASCSGAGDGPRSDAAAESPPSLAAAYGDAFRVGAALGRAQILGVDAVGRRLAEHHFNSLTAENAMKWERIHPEPGWYRFELADRFVELGEAQGAQVVGHTLVWHQQTPDWVFRDGQGGPASRDTLLARMREHIHQVVGRYRGRVHAWDVVNEALAEDGSLRPSPWLEIIGEEYIASAFRFAREADPDAALYYNDFSLANAPKREGAVRLIRELRARGVPVDGIGLQGHYRLDWPTPAQLDSTLRAFADLGVRVAVTELDVDVLPRALPEEGAEVSEIVPWRAALDPYATGLPPAVQDSLRQRYADLFQLFMEYRESLDRVTFWGVHDAASWRNDWPVRGRTNYPLLFDATGEPKEAFLAVLEVAGSSDP